jgi:kynurenine 3-monooxygenase
MPWSKFESIKTPRDLEEFFDETFPDSVPLIGREVLIHDYFKNDKGPLMSIKCKPYNISHKAVILGDAAHAMVPFYGQGMNCGFEDVLVLDEIFDKFLLDSRTPPTVKQLTMILDEYSRFRNPDAEAMCDLALHNYIEMRSSITKPGYLLRKKVHV